MTFHLDREVIQTLIYLRLSLATPSVLHLQKPGGTAFVIGEAGLTTALKDIGYELTDRSPGYVILGETVSYSFARLTTAVRLIKDGTLFIATNPDVVGPTEQRVVPACGAVAAMITAASGVKPYFIGKPNPLMMRSALRQLGAHSENTIMIGDRMETYMVRRTSKPVGWRRDCEKGQFPDRNQIISERKDMIYTITLNPALDRTLWVRKIEPDDSNRIEQERRYAGGKGIDVSKVLTTLGVDNKALGFVGGFAGEELEGLLLNEGIGCDFVRISNETRTNIIVNDQSTANQTVFSALGPEIKPYELMRMIRKVEKLDQPDIVIISGSLPLGIHPEICRKIIEIAKSQGARVILDADGEVLRMGLQGGPDVIKPNTHELSRLVGSELRGIDEIIGAARCVRDQGVDEALVSMGAAGILLVGEKESWLASPPRVEVKNTIGAGDSAVAGFVYGLVEGKNPQEALTWAVAAGTATTLRAGTALCRKDDIENLLPGVKLRAVQGQ